MNVEAGGQRSPSRRRRINAARHSGTFTSRRGKWLRKLRRCCTGRAVRAHRHRLAVGLRESFWDDAEPAGWLRVASLRLGCEGEQVMVPVRKQLTYEPLHCVTPDATRRNPVPSHRARHVRSRWPFERSGSAPAVVPGCGQPRAGEGWCVVMSGQGRIRRTTSTAMVRTRLMSRTAAAVRGQVQPGPWGRGAGGSHATPLAVRRRRRRRRSRGGNADRGVPDAGLTGVLGGVLSGSCPEAFTTRLG
jgi:hypothetical protein